MVLIIPVDNGEYDAYLEELGKDIDQTEQNFYFITVPSFVSLFSGSTIDPLYFVQITGKGVAEEDNSDSYVHFVTKGMRYFQGLNLEAVCSRNSRVRRY